MNRIITVGRQFGSGGRELGKRLADYLEVPYYDKEIVDQVAHRTQLAEEYVHKIVEKNPGFFFPITIGRSFQTMDNDYLVKQYTSIFSEQANVIKDLAEKSDCVIVGRCADHILRDMHPFRIFAYSDMKTRIERCRAKNMDQSMTDKQMEKLILKVDKGRAKYYQYYTGIEWGARENYDLCINLAGLPIKETAMLLADFIKNQKLPE